MSVIILYRREDDVVTEGRSVLVCGDFMYVLVHVQHNTDNYADPARVPWAGYFTT